MQQIKLNDKLLHYTWPLSDALHIVFVRHTPFNAHTHTPTTVSCHTQVWRSGANQGFVSCPRTLWHAGTGGGYTNHLIIWQPTLPPEPQLAAKLDPKPQIMQTDSIWLYVDPHWRVNKYVFKFCIPKPFLKHTANFKFCRHLLAALYMWTLWGQLGCCPKHLTLPALYSYVWMEQVIVWRSDSEWVGVLQTGTQNASTFFLWWHLRAAASYSCH